MESNGGLRNVIWAFLFIASGGLLFGYVIGINSNVITQGQLLCPEGFRGTAGDWGSWGYGQCYTLSPAAQGVLSSLNLIGACLSSLFCFRYADDLGRKLEVQLAAVLYIVGAVVAGAVPALWGVNLGFLIYGLGIGFAMHAAPAYIAEIAPADVRGSLISAKEACIVLGMFLGFLSGYAFSFVQPQGWRLMVLCATGLGMVMLLGISGVPESPRFLVLRAARAAEGALEGREAGGAALADAAAGAGAAGAPATSSPPSPPATVREEASRALQYFRQATAEEVEPELQSLLKDVTASLEEQDCEKQSLLKSGGPKAPGILDAFSHHRPMVVGCGLVLLQQVTGQPSVLYFATKIFKNAGFAGSSASMQSVVMGLVKLVATLFTAWKVDNYGRRALLFVGIAMMAVALAVLTGSFYRSHCKTPGTPLDECAANDIALPESWAIATVVALMLYVSGYQVGFGPIAWLMISEVFPLKVRGSALSVAAMVNFSANIVMAILTPVLLHLLAPWGIFAIFLGLAGVSLLFVYVFVPETRGKSLEEIETLMRS